MIRFQISREKDGVSLFGGDLQLGREAYAHAPILPREAGGHWTLRLCWPARSWLGWGVGEDEGRA